MKIGVVYPQTELGTDPGVLRDFAQAVECYERATQIEPAFAEAHYNRGNALQKLDRLEASLAAYDRALLARADSVEVLFARGNLLL